MRIRLPTSKNEISATASWEFFSRRVVGNRRFCEFEFHSSRERTSIRKGAKMLASFLEERVVQEIDSN